MKKISVFICAHLWTILLFVSINAQDFKTVQDGVEYAEMTREIDKTPVKMNLLRLDLTKVRLDVVHAMDAAIGLEKTSSIAARYGALAAINAGFFRIDRSIFEGDDVGSLQIDGKVLSESLSNRIALFIANSPQQTKISINHLNLIGVLAVNKQPFDAPGINRERKENDLVVYTPEFHRTTLTDPKGLEIVVQNGKITEILDGKGSSKIPAGGFVISASGKRRAEILAKAKIGAKASFMFTQVNFGNGLSDNPEDFPPSILATEDIVSGVPLLVLNGKIKITWEAEKSSKAFVETRHPRTAVARLKDGKFLMVTVDGRSESSGGIGLEDLAKLLLELGATDAMNLDGGGSSTMFLDGKVVNRPSDKEGERRVSDAILVFPRKKN
ncbi:MAG TPA: phosphodiester glycosidase family protein [Pyrinomonadaceae bacterium]|nr:phosphodiester glycosidase family protein [Pyrinomonadaceae bacterium]